MAGEVTVVLMEGSGSLLLGVAVGWLPRYQTVNSGINMYMFNFCEFYELKGT